MGKPRYASDTSAKRMDILVVDKEKFISEALCDYLNLEGHSCRHSVSGEEAISELRNKSTDVIIINHTVREFDGLNLLKVISEEYPAVKKIIFSNTRPDPAAPSEDVDDTYTYFRKPINMDKFLQTIENIDSELYGSDSFEQNTPHAVAGESSGGPFTERRLSAILSADVVGYSRLMGDDDVETLRTLSASLEVFQKFIHKFHGRVVNTPGDAVLAEFVSVADSVECAVQIQQELSLRNAEMPQDRRMHYRIGVNLGDVLVSNNAIYGDGVNIAARLEALSDGGGVCISGTVYDQIETKLDLRIKFLGKREVKNIRKPVRVYKIEFDGRGRTGVMPRISALLSKLMGIVPLAFMGLSL